MEGFLMPEIKEVLQVSGIQGQCSPKRTQNHYLRLINSEKSLERIDHEIHMNLDTQVIVKISTKRVSKTTADEIVAYKNETRCLAKIFVVQIGLN